MTEDARRPEARPEFRNLSESEVWKAVAADEDGNSNAISAEVTRLVVAYMCRFQACVARHGPVPPHIMYVRARWPIERVAVFLLASCIESESGAPPWAALQ